MDLPRKLFLTVSLLSFPLINAEPINFLNYFTLPSNSNVSEQCSLDIQRLNTNLKNFTSWAVEMWEATAKEEIGLLQGNYHQLGNFDECLFTSSPSTMKRQYCLVEVTVEDEEHQMSLKYSQNFDNARDVLLLEDNAIRWSRNKLLWAVCTPASCSISDLNIVMKEFKYFSQFSNSFNFTQTISFEEKYCQIDRSDIPYTFGSKAFISLFIILIITVILSTTYHHYSEQDQKCSELVKAFSIKHNFKSLFIKEDKNLRITYGLRVLTTSFIIGCHYINALTRGPLINRENIELLNDNLIYAMVPQLTGTFVDTFFVLGGFFAIYSLNRNFSSKRVIDLIISRYFRLIPIYAFLIFFTATLLPQSGSGPLWNAVSNEPENCQKNWWTNLLFLNNYVNSDQMCLIHSWYMPCDFHYYLIAIFLIHFLSDPKREKTGLIITGFLLGISLLIPPITIYVLNLPPILYMNNYLIKGSMYASYFKNIYIKSHTRFTSYALGLIMGYFYLKYSKRNNFKFTNIVSILIFSVAIFIYFAISLVLILVLDMNPPYDSMTSAIFAAFYRPIKALCICAMILVLIFGEVPIAKSFLGCTPMRVLGKLTYGAYLFSLIIQYRDIGSLRMPIYLSFIPTLSLNIWYNIISFSLSFIGYLLIEAPCNNLLKIFLKFKKRHSIINFIQTTPKIVLQQF